MRFGPVFASSLYDLTHSFSASLVITSIALVVTAIPLVIGFDHEWETAIYRPTTDERPGCA